MKNNFPFSFKAGARWLAVAAAGSTLAACSNTQPDAPGNAAPAPMEKMPDEKKSGETTSSPKTYRDVRGQIVSINAPAKNVAGAKTTATLDHEEIPDFMRAMRMTVPFKNADDAKKLKLGDKIVCDFVLENGSLILSNVRALPADTKLKLAPA